MTKQELLKQADYTFQRGNRELAKKYLSDFLAKYPEEEAAWMLMARILEDPEQKTTCYERVLKLNPNNAEAKIGLTRIKLPGKTIPKNLLIANQTNPSARPSRTFMRGFGIFVALVLVLGSTSFVVARNAPSSAVASLLTIPTPTLYAGSSINVDIASQTRARIGAQYPQYAPLVDALISFAVDNAESGLEGAPERPGVQMVPSETTALEAITAFEKALPQPGSLSSVTLTEKQLTSWLALEIQNTPDLPLSDMHVYLQNDRIQLWCMVNGATNSTSALITGGLGIDSNKNPKFQIESIQIGAQPLPGMLVSQMEAWLNQFILDKIAQQSPGLQVMNVNVSNGLITISGMR